MNVGGDVLESKTGSENGTNTLSRDCVKLEPGLNFLALDLLIDDARHFRPSATTLSVGSILIGEPNGFLSRSHC